MTYYGQYCGGSDDLTVINEALFTTLSKKKDTLIQNLYNELRGALKLKNLPETSNTDEMVAAMREFIPNPGRNKKAWVANAEKQLAGCRAAASAINQVFGSQVINLSDPGKDICGNVFEVMSALMSGINTEYLGLHSAISRSFSNMNAIQKYIDKVVEKLQEYVTKSADKSMKDRYNNMAQSYKSLSTAFNRQIVMLKGMLDEFGSVDPDIKQLMRESKEVENFVTKYPSLGTAEAGKKVAYVIDLFTTNAIAADKMKKLLDKLGIDVKDYLKSGGDMRVVRGLIADSVPSKLEKLDAQGATELMTAMAEVEKLNIMFDPIVEEWARKIETTGSGEFESETGVITGAEEKSGGIDELANRISKARKGRQALLKLFIQAFNSVTVRLLNSVKGITVFVNKRRGELPDLLNQIALYVAQFPDLRDRNVYLAISGYNTFSIDSVEIRERFISTAKHCVTASKSLYESTKEGAFNDLVNSLELLVKLIEGFSEKFQEFKIGDRTKKQLGEVSGAEEYEGGDMSDDYAAMVPTLNRSAYDFNLFVNVLQKEIRLSTIRHNMSVTAKNMTGYSEDYPAILGQAIGKAVDTVVRSKTEFLNKTSGKVTSALIAQYKGVAPGGVDPEVAARYGKPEMLNGELALISEMFDNRIDLLRSAETIDLYLKNFTQQINANPDMLQSISTVLDQAEIISKWFTNKSGDYICSAFEYFPHTTETKAASYVVNGNNYNKLASDHENEHYYLRISAVCQLGGDYGKLRAENKGVPGVHPKMSDPAANYANWSANSNAGDLPGIPQLGINYNKKTIESINNALKITMLKNIISLFLQFGSKFGDKNLNRGLHASPEKIYNILMDYIKFGSLNYLQKVVPHTTAFKFNSGIHNDNDLKAPKPMHGSQYPDGGTGKMVNILSGFNVDVAPGTDPKLDQLSGALGFGFDHIPVALNNANAGTAGTNAQLRNHYEIPSDRDCDDIYFMIVKAIVAKILVTLGVYGMYNKEADKMSAIGYQTSTRTIIGGAEVEIIDDIVELYIRLPLLVEFYKRIFKLSDTSKLVSNDGLVIGLSPEMDGLFSGLVHVIFIRNRNNETGAYSDGDLRLIIEEINKIYGKYKGKPNFTTAIIDDFIYEINLRYGLIKKDDLEKYGEIDQWRMENPDRLFNDQTNFELAEMTELGDYQKPTPSMNYQTESYVAPSTGQKTRPELKMNRDIALVRGLRADIDSFFDNATGTNSVFHDMASEDVEYPWSDKRTMQNFTNRISFVNIISATNNEVKQAKSADEKYRIVTQNILSLSNHTLGHLDRSLLAFHETVVTPLNLLYILYKKLLDNHLRIIGIHHAVKVWEECIRAYDDDVDPATNIYAPPGGAYGRFAQDEYLDMYCVSNPKNQKTLIPGRQNMAYDSIINPGGANGNAIIFPHSADVWNVMSDTAARKSTSNGAGPKFAKRFGLDLELVMFDVINVIHNYVSASNNLVDYNMDYEYADFANGTGTYKQNCRVNFTLNNSRLFEHIKKLFITVKTTFNTFRGLLPDTLLKKYESSTNQGSIYFLEKTLIDCLINGNNPDDLSKLDPDFKVIIGGGPGKVVYTPGAGFPAVYPLGSFCSKNDSLETNSRRLTEIMRFCNQEFEADLSVMHTMHHGLGIAAAPAAVTALRGSVVGDKISGDLAVVPGSKYKMFHEFTGLMYHMIFYDIGMIYGTTRTNVDGRPDAYLRNAFLNNNDKFYINTVAPPAPPGVGPALGAILLRANPTNQYSLMLNANTLGTEEYCLGKLYQELPTEYTQYMDMSPNVQGIEKCLFNNTGKKYMGTEPGTRFSTAPQTRLYYDNDEASGSSINLDGFDSIFHRFNKLLIAYLNVIYDSAYNSALATPIISLVNGPLSDEFIGDKNHANEEILPTYKFISNVGPNVYAQRTMRKANRSTTPMPLQGIIYKTTAQSVRYMFDISVAPEKKFYLQTDINMLPTYMKQKYREALPYFQNMFECLIKKCMLLKNMVDILNVEHRAKGETSRMMLSAMVSAPVAAAHNDAGLTAAYTADQTPINTKFVDDDNNMGPFAVEQNRQNLNMVLDRFINGCRAVITSISETMKAIGGSVRYMEISDEFTSLYEANNRMKPFMPLSSSLFVFRNVLNSEFAKQSFIPIRSGGSNIHKLMQGFRALLEKNPKYEQATGLDTIVKAYNGSVEPKFHLSDSSMKSLYECYGMFYSYLYESLVSKRITGSYFQYPGCNFGADAVGAVTGATGIHVAIGRSYFAMCHKIVHNENTRTIANYAYGTSGLKNKNPGTGNNLATYQLSEYTGDSEIIALTENSNQKSEIKKITKFLNSLSVNASCRLLNSRDTLIAFNIIDMNKVPINIHALMRDVPLINLINFSYTFDRMVAEQSGYDSEVANKVRNATSGGEMIRIYAHDMDPRKPLEHADVQNSLLKPKNLMAQMLINPYTNMGYDMYYIVFSQIMRGLTQMESLQSPRYLSEEIFNKPLFGEIFMSSTPDPSELGPATSFDNKFTLGLNLHKNEELLTGKKIDDVVKEVYLGLLAELFRIALTQGTRLLELNVGDEKAQHKNYLIYPTTIGDNSKWTLNAWVKSQFRILLDAQPDVTQFLLHAEGILSGVPLGTGKNIIGSMVAMAGIFNNRAVHLNGGGVGAIGRIANDLVEILLDDGYIPSGITPVAGYLAAGAATAFLDYIYMARMTGVLYQFIFKINPDAAKKQLIKTFVRGSFDNDNELLNAIGYIPAIYNNTAAVAGAERGAPLNTLVDAKAPGSAMISYKIGVAPKFPGFLNKAALIKNNYASSLVGDDALLTLYKQLVINYNYTTGVFTHSNSTLAAYIGSLVAADQPYNIGLINILMSLRTAILMRTGHSILLTPNILNIYVPSNITVTGAGAVTDMNALQTALVGALADTPTSGFATIINAIPDDILIRTKVLPTEKELRALLESGLNMEYMKAYLNSIGIMRFLIYSKKWITRDIVAAGPVALTTRFTNALTDLGLLYAGNTAIPNNINAQIFTGANPIVLLDSTVVPTILSNHACTSPNLALSNGRYPIYYCYSSPFFTVNGRLGHGSLLGTAVFRRGIILTDSLLTSLTMNIIESYYMFACDLGHVYTDASIGCNTVMVKPIRLIGGAGSVHNSNMTTRSFGNTQRPGNVDIYVSNTGNAALDETHGLAGSIYAQTIPTFAGVVDPLTTFAGYNVANYLSGHTNQILKDYGIITTIEDAESTIEAFLTGEHCIFDVTADIEKARITYALGIQDYHAIGKQLFTDVRKYFNAVYYAVFKLIECYQTAIGAPLTHLIHSDPLGFAFVPPTAVGVVEAPVNADTFYAIDGNGSFQVGASGGPTSGLNPDFPAVATPIAAPVANDSVAQGNMLAPTVHHINALADVRGGNLFVGSDAILLGAPDIGNQYKKLSITAVAASPLVAVTGGTPINSNDLTKISEIAGKCCMFLKGQDMLLSNGMQPIGTVYPVGMYEGFLPYYRGISAMGRVVDMLQMYLYYNFYALFGSDTKQIYNEISQLSQPEIIGGDCHNDMFRLNEVPVTRFQDFFFTVINNSAHAAGLANNGYRTAAGPRVLATNTITVLMPGYPRNIAETDAVAVGVGFGLGGHIIPRKYCGTFALARGSNYNFTTSLLGKIGRPYNELLYFHTPMVYANAVGFALANYLGFTGDALNGVLYDYDRTNSLGVKANQPVGAPYTGYLVTKDFDRNLNIDSNMQEMLSLAYAPTALEYVGTFLLKNTHVANAANTIPNTSMILSKNDMAHLQEVIGKILTITEALVETSPGIPPGANDATEKLIKLLGELPLITGSQEEYLTYPYRDRKTGSTKIARVHVGQYKNLLQYIGYLRFNTTFIRKVIWTAQVQRMLRYIMRTNLFQYESRVIKEHPVLATTNTENIGNRLYSNSPENEGY